MVRVMLVRQNGIERQRWTEIQRGGHVDMEIEARDVSLTNSRPSGTPPHPVPRAGGVET